MAIFNSYKLVNKSPSNYSYLRTINHSDGGVINQLSYLGGLSLYVCSIISGWWFQTVYSYKHQLVICTEAYGNSEHESTDVSMFTHLALGKLPLDIHQEHLQGAARNVFFFEMWGINRIYTDL